MVLTQDDCGEYFWLNGASLRGQTAEQETSAGQPVRFSKALLSCESGEEDQTHLLDRAPTQLALCLRFATDLKGESWLRVATLDDLKTPVLHNTSVVV
jgi:hypothetical protein